MNQEKTPSNYKVGMSLKYQRLAIMEKDTGNVVETFAGNMPEELLICRMKELREDEISRHRLTMGTSLEGTTGNEGIITTDLSMPETPSNEGDLII